VRGYTNEGDLQGLAKKTSNLEEMNGMAYRAAKTKKKKIYQKMWPTPSAGDDRDRGNLLTPAIKRRAQKGKQLNLSMVVSEESGSLNPQWVEWLMGFPAGWTDIADG
jgi:DNA (cytosine-5)-methyltransferase 1